MIRSEEAAVSWTWASFIFADGKDRNGVLGVRNKFTDLEHVGVSGPSTPSCQLGVDDDGVDAFNSFLRNLIEKLEPLDLDPGVSELIAPSEPGLSALLA